MPRKNNTKCTHCGKEFYCRPLQKSKFENHYCSRACYGQDNLVYKNIICLNCKIEFRPKKKTIKYCSKSCSTIATRGPRSVRIKIKAKNKTKERLEILFKEFSFYSCMIEGCEYSKTYDVHRFCWGKHGGTYVIGNMFAICPNHHAEIHRNIIKIEKVSNSLLRII